MYGAGELLPRLPIRLLLRGEPVAAHVLVLFDVIVYMCVCFFLYRFPLVNIKYSIIIVAYALCGLSYL